MSASAVSVLPRRPAPAGLVWMLDAIGAVAFAAGLAGALAEILRDEPMLAWLAVLAAGGTARAVATVTAARLGARDARRLKRRLRAQILSQALRAPPGTAGPLGERLAAVVDEIEALDGYAARFAPLRLAAAITPLALIGVTALASPISAAVEFATLVPFGLFMALAGMAAADAADRQLDALGRLSGLFVDRVRALPVVLAFQAEGRQTALVAAAAREVAERTLRVLRLAFLSSAGLEFFAAISVALVAVYCGFNLLRELPMRVPEQLDVFRAVFVLALAPEVYAPLRRLAGAYHDKQAGEAAAARLAAWSRAERPPPPAAVLGKAPEIRFDAAVVRYENGEEVGPFTFTAPAGGITALVGASGAGKTSLLALLAGAAPLGGGEVWVDGRPLSRERSFAGDIAWAGQAPTLVPGDIAGNIALGRSGASAAEVAQAARDVGLWPALAVRAHGLATAVDERGAGLSGGERRRLGLARAWLKDAPILCLDEPTADLDAASEAALLEVLRRMSAGRTVLVATHSARVAALADQVVRIG